MSSAHMAFTCPEAGISNLGSYLDISYPVSQERFGVFFLQLLLSTYSVNLLANERLIQLLLENREVLILTIF